MVGRAIGLIRKGNTFRRLFRSTGMSLSDLASIVRGVFLAEASGKVTVADVLAALDTHEESPYILYRHFRREMEKLEYFDEYPSEPDYQWLLSSYPGKVDRIHVVVQLMQTTSSVPGHVAEFGVYKGHTALVLARTMQSQGMDKELYLFDSFRGLPTTITELDGDWKPGTFSDTSVELLMRLMAPYSFATIVPGFFAECFPQYPALTLSFCHVDSDLEVSVRECCEYVVPRLSPGGIIVFDDYGFPSCRGAKAAVDAFFAHRGEHIVYLPTAQAIYLKPPADPLSGNCATI